MMLLFASSSAWACAVCGGGGQNQQAFIDTMIFMSLMPLAMLGGFFFVVWRLSKAAAVNDAAAKRTSPASPPQ